MNEKISELLEDLNEYYKDNNWLIVKKFLLKYLHPDIRKKFTTRHHKTKKHSLNNFEKEIIKYYYDRFDIRLELYEKDKHKQ
tara:strand:- start:190 stop:435 length:246 start_codon:yes stop_codon:yes gene_type:complete